MDDINLGLYPRPRLCPLGLTTNYELFWCPCLYCGASLNSFSQAVATSHPTLINRPPTPYAMLAQNWCAPSKTTRNGLKSSRQQILSYTILNSIDQ